MKRLLPLALLAIAVVGCKPRIKALESFTAATTPHPATNWAGDVYSYGGIAQSSGGLRPGTFYGRGANPQGRPNPSYDRPAKGTGLQPGEVPPTAAPWWAQSNAPIYQPAPGEENAHGTRIPQ